jgi:hypothetical protein
MKIVQMTLTRDLLEEGKKIAFFFLNEAIYISIRCQDGSASKKNEKTSSLVGTN